MVRLSSIEKLRLERKLVRLRSELFYKQLNLLGLSFCTFIFYPIIIMMGAVDPMVGLKIVEGLESKSDHFEALLGEFNETVDLYNSL
jgi:hypothetical protein